jgi:hypothetical protein
MIGSDGTFTDYLDPQTNSVAQEFRITRIVTLTGSAPTAYAAA